MSYVVVSTLVDGRVAVLRDYWNPLTLLDAALSQQGRPRHLVS